MTSHNEEEMGNRFVANHLIISNGMIKVGTLLHREVKISDI